MIQRLLLLLMIALFSPTAFSQTVPPALPQVTVISGFLGLNQGIAQLSQQLRAQDVGVFATMNVDPPHLANGRETNGQPTQFIPPSNARAVSTPAVTAFMPPAPRNPASQVIPLVPGSIPLPEVQVINGFIPINTVGTQNGQPQTPSYPTGASPGTAQ